MMVGEETNDLDIILLFTPVLTTTDDKYVCNDIINRTHRRIRTTSTRTMEHLPSNTIFNRKSIFPT